MSRTPCGNLLAPLQQGQTVVDISLFAGGQDKTQCPLEPSKDIWQPPGTACYNAHEVPAEASEMSDSYGGLQCLLEPP